MIVSSRLSAKKLRRNMDRLIQQLPVQQQGIAWQNLDNAIFSQFLDGIAVIKGGASLALRYPLEQGRTSRDLDATVTDSMNMFIAILKTGFVKESTASPAASNPSTEQTAAA